MSIQHLDYDTSDHLSSDFMYIAKGKILLSSMEESILSQPGCLRPYGRRRGGGFSGI